MKELTELENAIATRNLYDNGDIFPEDDHLRCEGIVELARRLITRLKECDLGEIKWDSEELGMMAAISFDDPDEEFIGKSGQLYFVAEESET